MNNSKLIGGIILIATALVLASMTVFFPENGFFTVIWDMGIATFRGDGSLGLMYVISGVFLFCGTILLLRHRKAE